MTIGFFARTQSANTDDGKGRISVRFQRNAAPYPGFGDTLLRPDGEWGWYEVSATLAKRQTRRGSFNDLMDQANRRV